MRMWPPSYSGFTETNSEGQFELQLIRLSVIVRGTHTHILMSYFDDYLQKKKKN